MFIAVWVVLVIGYGLLELLFGLGSGASESQSYGQGFVEIANGFGTAALMALLSASIVSYVSARLTKDRKWLAAATVWAILAVELLALSSLAQWMAPVNP